MSHKHSGVSLEGKLRDSNFIINAKACIEEVSDPTYLTAFFVLGSVSFSFMIRVAMLTSLCWTQDTVHKDAIDSAAAARVSVRVIQEHRKHP